MNCSLNSNTSHDPIMKSGFTIQPLQKHGLFHKVYMSCDSVMLMKIPPKGLHHQYQLRQFIKKMSVS